MKLKPIQPFTVAESSHPHRLSGRRLSGHLRGRLRIALVAISALMTLPPSASGAPAEKGAPTRPAEAAATGDEAAPVVLAAKIEAGFSFARAKFLADEGEFSEALREFHRAIELDPNDPYSLIELSKFHTYLGQIAHSESRQLDQLRLAAKYAEQARQLAPDNLDALRRYAQVHLRLVESQQIESLEIAERTFEQIRARTQGDLQVLTALGQIYLWQRKHPQAVEVLEEAISASPGQPMILNMLSDAMLEAGESQKAEGVLVQLLAADPTALEHRLRLADIRSERGDHRGAVEVLRSGPADTLSSPRLRQVLARELHLAGDNDRALELTDALLAEFPTAPGLRRLRISILNNLGRYAEALNDLEPLLDPQTGDERAVQDIALYCRLLERVGRADEAAAKLRQVETQLDGTGALQTRLTLVGVLERDGRGDEAIDILRRELAEAEKADDVESLSRLLVQLMVRFDREDEALRVVEETAARIDPAKDPVAAQRLQLQRIAVLAVNERWDDVMAQVPKLEGSESAELRTAAYVFSAEALAARDEVDEALKRLAAGQAELGSDGSERLLAERIELLYESDRDSEAKQLIEEQAAGGEEGDLLSAAQLYQRAGRYAESAAVLQRLLRDHPESRDALFLLGSAQERSGEREASIGTFRRLLELAPDHAPTLNYLGYMWAEQGENLADALAMIRRAVALDPDNGAYIDSLGWALFQLRRYDEARQHLEWAARLIPDDPTILEHLGDLYVVLKDVERARATYQQALDLGGDSPDELRHKLQTLEEKGL